jgi:chitinase
VLTDNSYFTNRPSAFAILDSNYNIVFTGWNSDDLLKRTVKLGHAAGKKVKLSIGGWTGSGCVRFLRTRVLLDRH